MTDPVNHPAHYTEHPSGIECIQITEHMGFNLGNAVKYIWRADLKGSAIEDLEKARWYINRELTKRDALFPATEPAEVISRYQTMQRGFAAKDFGFPANPVFEDRYTAPDGGKWQWTDELQWELRCYPPAPAVPAGEETKAEVDGDFIEIVFDGPPEAVSGRFVEVENPQGASISVGEWIDRGDGFWALRIPYPSSPVVPAPTETEWQTWQEVPEGVWFLTNQNIGCWMRRDGDKVTTVTGGWPVCTDSLVAQAPFVAAEEG